MSILVKALKLPWQFIAVAILPVLIATAGLPCGAQNVGNWTMNNELSGTGGTNNTAGNISLGPAISSHAFNGGTDFFGEGGWPTGGINTNAYMQFTLTPNAGFGLDLTGLIIRMRRSTTGNPSGSGPTQWSLRSSVDGFATDIASGTITHSHSNYSIAPGSNFHQIPVTVTFRLYGYNTTISSGGLNRLVLDNISVQGLAFVLPVRIADLRIVSDDRGLVTASLTAHNILAGTRFTLQRSLNGIDFSDVQTISETEDRESRNYILKDGQPPTSKTFYRIKGTEPDGNIYLSDIKTVSGTALQTTINDVIVRGGSILSRLQIATKNTYILSVFTANGVCIQQKRVNFDAGMQVVHLPVRGMSRGNYVLSMYDGKEIITRQFVY